MYGVVVRIADCGIRSLDCTFCCAAVRFDELYDRGAGKMSRESRVVLVNSIADPTLCGRSRGDGET